MRICRFLPLIMLVFVCGCDPFDNAEQRFPLPEKVWDRAEKSASCKAFVFRGISETGFLEIKAALLSKQFTESGCDFYFLSAENKNPVRVKSSDAVILVRRNSGTQKTTSDAVAYLKNKCVLMAGQGHPEP